MFRPNCGEYYCFKNISGFIVFGFKKKTFCLILSINRIRKFSNPVQCNRNLTFCSCFKHISSRFIERNNQFFQKRLILPTLNFSGEGGTIYSIGFFFQMVFFSNILKWVSDDFGRSIYSTYRVRVNSVVFIHISVIFYQHFLNFAETC